MVGEENMNLAIIKAGLAKVIEKKGNIPATKNYEALQTAQNEAKAKKTGVWNTDEKYIEKNTRNVTYFSDTGYNAQKIFEEAKGCKEPLDGIVEYVFNASFVSVYLSKF